MFWSGWTAHFLSHYEKSKLSWPLWFDSIWFYSKMNSDDLSLHVPFMLKCFFIIKVLIILNPLYTLQAMTHQLHSARVKVSEHTHRGSTLKHKVQVHTIMHNLLITSKSTYRWQPDDSCTLCCVEQSPSRQLLKTWVNVMWSGLLMSSVERPMGTRDENWRWTG